MFTHRASKVFGGRLLFTAITRNPNFSSGHLSQVIGSRQKSGERRRKIDPVSSTKRESIMKKSPPTRQHRTAIKSMMLSGRKLSGILLTAVGVLLALTSVYAIRRVPFVSWIPDQRITSATAPSFATQ